MFVKQSQHIATIMELSIPISPFSGLYDWLVRMFSDEQSGHMAAELPSSHEKVSDLDTEYLSHEPADELAPAPAKAAAEEEEPLPTLEDILGKDELEKTLALLQEIQGHLPANTSIRAHAGTEPATPSADRASQVLNHLKRLT